MKETESIKEYYNRLLDIANRVRLLESSLLDLRIVIPQIILLQFYNMFWVK